MVILLYMIATITEAYTLISLNDSIRASHSSEDWKYFELSNPERTEGYVRLTLHCTLSEDWSMVLSVRRSLPPEFSPAKTDVEGDFIDYDGWKLQSTRQYIILEESYLNTTDPIIVGVGITVLSAASPDFTLVTENSSEALCPNNCSGTGTCNDGTCLCAQGYINYDCGTQASYLTNNQYATIDISVGASKYAYFYKAGMKTVSLEFNWGGQALLVAMDWNDHFKVELPTETDYHQQFVLAEGERIQKMRIDMKEIKGEILYIGVFNTYNDPTTAAVVSLRYKDISQVDHMTAILYVLIGVSGFIIILWIVGGIIRCKFSRRQFQEANPIRHLGRPTGVPRDIVDKVCPMIQFKDAEHSQDMTCTICLEQFKPSDHIRRLKCRHIFHANCIEEWFSSNKNCCLCKRDCSVVEDLDVTVDRRPQSLFSDPAEVNAD